MADFNKAIEVILKNEGGYVNNPNDPGGETNFGICKKSYPKVDIKNLTKDGAKAIYKKDYWDKVNGDQINDQNLATSVFDFAVNAGTGTAIKQIQKTLNVTADGVLGPKTMAALNSSSGLSKSFAKRRVRYYIDIVKNKPTQIEFLVSWINRTIDLV